MFTSQRIPSCFCVSFRPTAVSEVLGNKRGERDDGGVKEVALGDVEEET
jgi:hypothetical protein